MLDLNAQPRNESIRAPLQQTVVYSFEVLSNRRWAEKVPRFERFK